MFIAHRGNTEGPKPELENTPDYIVKALQKYDVEIDVWFNEGFWLGHDEPKIKIPTDFLLKPNLWCHAKNIPALRELMTLGVHCFYHQNDDCTLTSKGHIWTYPGKELVTGSIAVMPPPNTNTEKCYAVCSDHA
jgi:hypothetical protein